MTGFWRNSFHVGSGSERAAEASVFSGISLLPQASTPPSTESHTETELVRPRQGRENSTGSELEASLDPA